LKSVCSLQDFLGDVEFLENITAKGISLSAIAYTSKDTLKLETV
jgi:hypothetical protein